MRLHHLLATSAAVSLAVGIPSWAAGFTITPTYTTGITTDSNSAAIISTINSVIGVYQSTLTNAVNINITFDKMTTGLAQSQWAYYTVPYATYYSALTAKATSPDQTLALAHTPGGATNPVTGSANIFVKAANLIALGFTGIDNANNKVTINTTLTTPGSAGTSAQYSLIAATEHEIDEVLGMGSSLDFDTTNPLPLDLYRYGNSAGVRSYTTSTAATSFFSIDGITHLTGFNQSSGGDHGDWLGGGSPQVNDAFGTPGSSPTLGSNEIRALNVLGYGLASAAPEPSAAAILVAGLGFVPAILRRRRN